MATFVRSLLLDFYYNHTDFNTSQSPATLCHRAYNWRVMVLIKGKEDVSLDIMPI